MKRKILLLLLLFNFMSFIYCQSNIDVKKLDTLFYHAISNNVFNGSALIVHQNSIIYQNSFGFNNKKIKSKNDLNTLYSIGSISKQYCAVGIMYLSDLGLLNVDDKYSKYFPDFPKGEKFTIRHLLNHTSGIPNWTNSSRHPFFRVIGRPSDFIDGISDEVVYNYLKKYNKLDFNPGERYSYSNSGYVLLSHLISKVSGKPYWKFMKDEIFKPLKLTNTFINSDPNLIQNQKAIGYNNFGEKDDNNLKTGGDGGVYTTVEDMHKWNQVIKAESFLSKEAYKQIFSIPILNNSKELRTNNDYTSNSIYGFGWIFTKADGENIIRHDGGINGISAINHIDINRDYEIILCSNQGTSNPLVHLYENIEKILKEEPFELYKIPIELKFVNQIKNMGFKEALNWFKSLNKQKKDSFLITPYSLNNLGYYYLNKRMINKAKDIFRLNLIEFPENGNLWDSYAEAFYHNKEYSAALALYEKSLKLTSENDNAKAIIQRIK